MITFDYVDLRKNIVIDIIIVHHQHVCIRKFLLFLVLFMYNAKLIKNKMIYSENLFSKTRFDENFNSFYLKLFYFIYDCQRNEHTAVLTSHKQNSLTRKSSSYDFHCHGKQSRNIFEKLFLSHSVCIYDET